MACAENSLKPEQGIFVPPTGIIRDFKGPFAMDVLKCPSNMDA
jgi:hypothetical protein